MQKINVKVQKILPWAQIPQYDTSNSAGCDIAVAIQNETILYPGEFKSYSTGIAMKIEPGYEAQLRSRAGMAKKYPTALRLAGSQALRPRLRPPPRAGASRCLSAPRPL